MQLTEINLAKEALKYRMRCGGTNLFEEYETEIDHIKNLLLRSSEIAESNSLIVVGPRGCGKTTVSFVNLFYKMFLNLFISFRSFKKSLQISCPKKHLMRTAFL